MSAFAWKPFLVGGVFLAEVALLAAVVLSAQSGSAGGVAVRSGEARIEATDQSNVTTQVVIARVVAPSDAWVVVQSDDAAGAPGAIMGVAHVDKGERLKLSMPMKSVGPLPVGAFITLVADLGQNGQFEYAPSRPEEPGGLWGMVGWRARDATSTEKPFIADGRVVRVRIGLRALSHVIDVGRAFIATASLSPGSTSVVASGVVAPGPSWLAVSLVTTSGAQGPVLGVTHVDSTTTGTVSVSVGMVGRAQRLLAVLHIDMGTPFEFEFNPSNSGLSRDVPYVAGGEPVAVPVSGVP